MMVLHEDSNTVDVYIYVDDTTGKAYFWNGKEYQELEGKQGKDSSKSQSPSSNGNSQSNQDSQKGSSNNNSGNPSDVQIGQQGSQADHDARMKRRQAELDKEGAKESEAEKQDRLNRIKDKLQDDNLKKAIVLSSKNKLALERVRGQKDLKQYRENALDRFEVSLYNFIKRAISKEKKKTHSRFNIPALSYGELKPGKAKVRSKNIPKINVYFDNSGSWDADKIKVGKDALGVLSEFERKKELKVELYYFSNKVYTEPPEPGGTSGQPILDNIVQTEPDNVIVMTDSDIRDCETVVHVPGAVWFLWKGGQSDNLREHLIGDTITEEYNLDNL